MLVPFYLLVWSSLRLTPIISNVISISNTIIIIIHTYVIVVCHRVYLYHMSAENRLCTPNPCEHSGICNVTGPSSYSCDCDGTGYTGTRCEIGVIETPDYPPLTLLTRRKFTLFANPDFELTIQLRAGTGLDFNPNVLPLLSIQQKLVLT